MWFKPLVALSIALLASPSLARKDWFPPQSLETSAHQMIQRFTQVGIELPNSEEDQLQRARDLIQKLVNRVDEWGPEGVLGHAPELAKIDIPEFDNPLITAIVLYGACALPLRPDLVDTAEEKSVIVLGQMSVAIVSAFLRHEYLVSGDGTEADLAAALSSDQMDRLFYEIQAVEDTRNYIATQCDPTFDALWKGTTR